MIRDSKAGIVSLGPERVPEVAKLHSRAFPSSAITRLGYEAVRRYYEWQFGGPHQAFYTGAQVGEDLAGFCIYGRFNSALGGYLAKNRVFLASRLLLKPWLLLQEEIASAVPNAVRVLMRRSLFPQHRTRPANEVAAKSFGILSIAVSPDHRRLGIGVLLMDECERKARTLGIEKMELTVDPSNTGAVRFYEKLGWFQVAKAGRWTGIMNKELRV